jgi:hypothetical protein
MKLENALRLARKARGNVLWGGCSALHLAKRAERITGSCDALEIVSRVYSHPQGRAAYECPECGAEYLTSGDAAACCEWKGGEG